MITWDAGFLQIVACKSGAGLRYMCSFPVPSHLSRFIHPFPCWCLIMSFASHKTEYWISLTKLLGPILPTFRHVCSCPSSQPNRSSYIFKCCGIKTHKMLFLVYCHDIVCEIYLKPGTSGKSAPLSVG